MKKNLKYIIDYINQFPEPYYSKAMKYCNEVKWCTRTANSKENALQHAFVWGDTSEGHDYWQEVYKLLSIEEINNPPTISDLLKKLEL